MSHETFGSWDSAEHSLTDPEEYPRQQARPFDPGNLFHESSLAVIAFLTAASTEAG
jgi:hypothetical protein